MPDFSDENCTKITGSVLEIAALRFTPAGVPALSFRIEHRSEQVESGVQRVVNCEISAIAFGSNAHLMDGAKPGDKVELTGFLNAKSLKSRSLILHVTKIEFLEGN